MHWLATNSCSICERPLHPGKGTCQACRTDPIASLRAALKETREELRATTRKEPTVNDQNKDMDRALNLAREYCAASKRGDMDRADQIRTTLDELGIGAYVGGKWKLAEPILRAMGLVEATTDLRPVTVKDVVYRLASDMVLARLIVAADEAVLAYADVQLAYKRRWQDCQRLREEERALVEKVASCGAAEMAETVEAWRVKYANMRSAEADVFQTHVNPDARYRAEEALGEATRALQNHVLATYLRGALREQLM